MLRLSSVRATLESLWSLCQSTSTILDPRIWPSTSSGQKYSHKTEPIVVLSIFKFLPFAQGKPTSAWIQGETLKWKSYLEGSKRIQKNFFWTSSSWIKQGGCWAPSSPCTSPPYSSSSSPTWPTTSSPSSSKPLSLSTWLWCWWVSFSWPACLTF